MSAARPVEPVMVVMLREARPEVDGEHYLVAAGGWMIGRAVHHRQRHGRAGSWTFEPDRKGRDCGLGSIESAVGWQIARTEIARMMTRLPEGSDEPEVLR